jgi:VCBS repeat protein
MGVAWSDVDGDGRPDLFVANDAGPNFLYKNNGNGTFVDVALQAGTALSENGKEQGSMGVAIADYDHSGGWSIFVTNFSDEYNALYRHDQVSSSPTCPSRRRPQSPACRSSAGARISWITTTTDGSTCWSSTATSTRKWSGPGSRRGTRSANCSTATSPAALRAREPDEGRRGRRALAERDGPEVC